MGDLGPGMYMLLLTAPEDVRDSQVVLVSKTGLTLKRTDRQVLAWATDIGTGLPVAGLPVTFYNAKGEKLTAGVTDADGIVMSDIPQTIGLVHALAVQGSDVAAASSDWQTGVEPWRFPNIAWEWQPESKDYNVFIYTDRPLYRPGQTVYFKGIVRADQDGQYSQPPEGASVYVEIANWNNQVLYKKTLKTTAFGSINDSFMINDEAKLGDYQIRVEVGKEPDADTLEFPVIIPRRGVPQAGVCRGCAHRQAKLHQRRHDQRCHQCLLLLWRAGAQRQSALLRVQQ